VWLSVRIVLASRRHQEDLELAARLRDALPVACDVRSPADRRALVQGAINRFGQIDILVNNAGVAYAGPAEDESPEHVQDLIDTNLSAVFRLSQLATAGSWALTRINAARRQLVRHIRSCVRK